MDNTHDVKVLKTLIKTTIDSAKGFADAAGKDQHTQHSQFYGQMADERHRCAEQLQARVSALGGEPKYAGSFAGAAHRGFMDVKQAVMGDSDEAIVAEVERGEDYLKDRYETALQDGELSPETRQAIQEAYRSVRKGHDRTSAMKHQMEG
jgi:uncharacterized protein (TIGR02284 family)